MIFVCLKFNIYGIFVVFSGLMLDTHFIWLNKEKFYDRL